MNLVLGISYLVRLVNLEKLIQGVSIRGLTSCSPSLKFSKGTGVGSISEGIFFELTSMSNPRSMGEKQMKQLDINGSAHHTTSKTGTMRQRYLRLQCVVALVKLSLPH